MAAWKVVPVDPTMPMLREFNDMAQCAGFIDKGYAAMLDAAPSDGVQFVYFNEEKQYWMLGFGGTMKTDVIRLPARRSP